MHCLANVIHLFPPSPLQLGVGYLLSVVCFAWRSLWLQRQQLLEILIAFARQLHLAVRRHAVREGGVAGAQLRLRLLQLTRSIGRETAKSSNNNNTDSYSSSTNSKASSGTCLSPLATFLSNLRQLRFDAPKLILKYLSILKLIMHALQAVCVCMCVRVCIQFNSI